MAELTFNLIRQIFKTQSITQKDYLTSEQLYNVVSKLNASQFDQETFEQIWDQCKLNSKGEVRISDFIEIIIKGEELLIEKQQQNTNEISKLESEKKGKLTDFSDMHRYKEQMDVLLQEKMGIGNSLAIIRKPFILSPQNIIHDGHPARSNANPQQRQQIIEENDVMRQLFDYDSSETASTLTTIFYLTTFLTVLAWLSSFFICQFLSMIVYTVILSQFIFQTISRKIIKFNLILLLACTFFDILWLILQTGHYWYPPTSYQLASFTSSYLKFSVFFIIAGVCLRLVLMYFYLSQFHIDQFQVYTIKVFGRDLNIQRQAEPFTPNKHPYSSLLEPFFNKVIVEGQPIQ